MSTTTVEAAETKQTQKRGCPSADEEGAPPAKKAKTDTQAEITEAKWAARHEQGLAKKKLDDEWAADIPKKVIRAEAFKGCSLYNVPEWGMWREPYEKAVAEFKLLGEGDLVQDPLYALFATLAKYISGVDCRSWIGTYELQLWIHSAIYADIINLASGTAKRQIAGLVRIRDSAFSKGSGRSHFATICDRAIRHIRDRHDPLICGELLWQRNERFAIDVPKYLKETADSHDTE
jgi:hypothetical protein